MPSEPVRTGASTKAPIVVVRPIIAVTELVRDRVRRPSQKHSGR